MRELLSVWGQGRLGWNFRFTEVLRLISQSMLGVTLCSTYAAGGIYIKQQIDTVLNGKKLQSQNEWFVDQGKFKLKSTSEESTTEYLFTGTVFYVCGRLSPSQIEILKARNISKGVADSLAKGTCQVVPSNFMVRFFLSPSTSVESVDASDGLKLTLALSNYSSKKTGEKIQTAGTTCEPWQRSYAIQKTKVATDGQALNIKSVVQESLCLEKGVDWRKSLWREVSKAVLVQPGGAALMNELRKDFQLFLGLGLKGRVEQSIQIIGKDPQTMSMTITPVKYMVQEFAPGILRLPQGVHIFNPESHAQQGEAVATSSSSKDPKKKSNGQNIVDFLQSAVFCGLARGICIQQ